LYNAALTEEEISENGDGLRAIASLTDIQYDITAVCVIPDPIPDENENHALIQKSETEIQLTKKPVEMTS